MPLNSDNIILLGLKVLGIAETTAKKFPFFSFLLPKNKTKKILNISLMRIILIEY